MNIQLLCLAPFLLSAATALAGENSSPPYGYLGMPLAELRSEVLSVTYDGDFFDEYYNGKVDERWLVIDKDRRFLTLHTADKFITGIFISDDAYVTERNIRVGDTLSEVRTAYPHARFRAGTDGVASGIYDLVTEQPRIFFWFDSREVRERIVAGNAVDINDEIVQQLRLSTMHITK